MPQIEFNITSEFEQIAEVCEQVREFLSRNSVNEGTRINVEIILTETMNNIIEHGYGKQPGKNIEGNIELSERSITVAIKDTGTARKNERVNYIDFDPEDIVNLPERGLGLMIIDKIADATEYKSENGVNEFKIKLEMKRTDKHST